MCNVFPARKDELSLEDLGHFIDQIKDRHDRVRRIKIVGGEPLLHSRFEEMYRILLWAAQDGIFDKLVVQTNGTVPRPHVPASPLVSWKTSHPKKKCHIPFMWASADFGLTAVPCNHPWACGYAYWNGLWYPCSPAVQIDEVFHLGIGRKELPDPAVPWAMEKLCGLCGFGLPAEFRLKHAKPLADFTPEMLAPSATWKKALEL